jgi:hypothetical protein
MASILFKFVTMRFPIDLYEQVKAQAIAESRSVSGQIVYLVRKALELG